MKPLKIVLVSANCFPYLGPRAHRTTELAKEFARKGHNVTVYTLLGNYDYTKYSDETGIIFKSLGKSQFGLKDNTGRRNKNIIIKIFNKIFNKLIAFPYIELTFLVKKSLKNVKDIDLLITIAHPHSIHWAIPLLANKNYKTWIADCGDPFMGDPFNKYPFYFKTIETKWCKKVDYITIPIEEGKLGYYSQFRNKIKVIPQGFNFKDVKLAVYKKNKVPTFAYSGIIYEGKRDPTKFIKYLLTLEFDFKFIIYTKSIAFFEQFETLLNDKLELRNYVQRDELLFELSKMDFLINIRNNSTVQQPSKLIDYYLTKRPILEITTDFLEKNNFDSFIKGNYASQLDSVDIEKYNIENIANSFIKLIE